MKTIILNGSPRENGDTASLINKLTEQLNGKYIDSKNFLNQIPI